MGWTWGGGFQNGGVDTWRAARVDLPVVVLHYDLLHDGGRAAASAPLAVLLPALRLRGRSHDPVAAPPAARNHQLIPCERGVCRDIQ